MSKKVIVCDANVVIQCLIIHENFFSKLSHEGYAFHFNEKIISQLKGLSQPNSRLYTTLGPEHFAKIFSEIDVCNTVVEYDPHTIGEAADDLVDVEQSLSKEKRSSPSDPVDRTILALSLENQIAIATQEKSLYNLALVTHEDPAQVWTTLTLFDRFIEIFSLNRSDIISTMKRFTKAGENITNLKEPGKLFFRKNLPSD